MSNTTPAELLADWETSTETNNRVTVGRADAVFHVGKLMTGEWSPAFVSDIQAELADTSSPVYDARYHYGYLTAWNTVAGLIKGEPLKTIAKANG